MDPGLSRSDGEKSGHPAYTTISSGANIDSHPPPPCTSIPPQTLESLDRRTRTLTTLLAIIQEIDLPFCKKVFNDISYGTVFLPTTDAKPHFGAPRESSLVQWLKVLNSIARLLVREHEIVAVLPKRSGPDGRVSMVVSIDSDSGSEDSDLEAKESDPPRSSFTKCSGLDARIANDEEFQQCASEDLDPEGITEYVSTRNSRTGSPEGAESFSRESALERLAKVQTEEDMIRYLFDYPRVLFETHVESVEILINNIIKTSSDKVCSTTIFHLYLMFRSAPKISRRFSSTIFQQFMDAMRGLKEANLQLALESAMPSPITLSTIELAVIRHVLTYEGVDSKDFPSLCQHDERQPLRLTVENLGEFHRLFLILFNYTEEAIETVAAFSRQKHMNTVYEIFRKSVRVCQIWMWLLDMWVHCCPIFTHYMKALEPYAVSSADLSNSVNDIDHDDGPTDTDIELNIAQASCKGGQKFLLLMVCLQADINLVVSKLPKTPIRLTFLQAHIESPEKRRQCDDWNDVIASLYPIVINSHLPPGHRNSQVITSEEAIDALLWYGREYRCRNLSILQMAPSEYKFSGCSHAESILASERWQKQTSNPHNGRPTKHQDVLLNSYFRIGVSKRCCPVCTRLLSLLAVGVHQSHQSVTYASHNRIYPTALPTNLPIPIAIKLVEWLEGLVKTLVRKVVVKKRKLSQSSQDSADSKGESSPYVPMVSSIWDAMLLGTFQKDGEIGREDMWELYL